ncbi:MAG: sigma-54-dependent transcriptional regulator [Planctomycetota bacterium]|jgi:DNA-binding NtrC family response regulator
MNERTKPRVLIVEPDAAIREHLTTLLSRRDCNIETAANGAEGLEVLVDAEIDVMITELRLPDIDGMELLQHAQHTRKDLPVIMVTAFGSVEDAVNAMREGAADFLSQPVTEDQVLLAVDRSLEKHRLVLENLDLKEALDDRVRLDNFIATDPALHSILKAVKSVAGTRTTVLLTGESGTGKTLLARAIHQLSTRREGPFVEVNCGALPENLLESELFGHVHGAFTGAVKDRAGKFEAADSGTIFLDEIGTSSPGFQVKLLRVLQDRVIERVGDTKTIPVDVRVILASNLDLELAVREGTFREDLYYRIQVLTLEMPPLRARLGDIPYLAEHFLERFLKQTDNPKRIRGFSGEAMDVLVRAPWPGNIRQLENVVERAVVLTEHELIQPEDLPPGLIERPQSSHDELILAPQSHLLPLKEGLLAPEKLLIERALAHHGGNRTLTARTLGINRSTLFNKMRKFDLL